MRTVLLFQSIHKVMKAEKICKKEGIEYTIIPVPKHISSECGMCMEVEPERAEAYKNILEVKQLEVTIASF